MANKRKWSTERVIVEADMAEPAIVKLSQMSNSDFSSFILGEMRWTKERTGAYITCARDVPAAFIDHHLDDLGITDKTSRIVLTDTILDTTMNHDAVYRLHHSLRLPELAAAMLFVTVAVIQLLQEGKFPFANLSLISASRELDRVVREDRISGLRSYELLKLNWQTENYAFFKCCDEIRMDYNAISRLFNEKTRMAFRSVIFMMAAHWKEDCQFFVANFDHNMESIFELGLRRQA